MKPVETGFFQNRLKTTSPMMAYTTLNEQMRGHAEDWRKGMIRMHKEELYLAKYKSFEEYCEAEWGYTGKHCRMIIRAEGMRSFLLSSGSEEVRSAASKMSDLALDSTSDPVELEESVKEATKNGDKPTKKNLEKKSRAVDVEFSKEEMVECPCCESQTKKSKVDEFWKILDTPDEELVAPKKKSTQVPD